MLYMYIVDLLQAHGSCTRQGLDIFGDLAARDRRLCPPILGGLYLLSRSLVSLFVRERLVSLFVPQRIFTSSERRRRGVRVAL